MAETSRQTRIRYELRYSDEGRDIIMGMIPDENGDLDLDKNVKEYILKVIDSKSVVTSSTLEIAMNKYMRAAVEIMYELSNINIDNFWDRYEIHKKYENIRHLKKVLISYSTRSDMIKQLSKTLEEFTSVNCNTKEKMDYIIYLANQIHYIKNFDKSSQNEENKQCDHLDISEDTWKTWT